MFAINQPKPVNNHTKQASLQRENLINQGYKPKTCVFNSYQINLAIRPAPTEKPSTNPRQGVLALTIKHTVEFSRSGRASPVHSLLSVWREATVQTYPTRFPVSTRRFQRVNPVSGPGEDYLIFAAPRTTLTSDSGRP